MARHGHRTTVFLPYYRQVQKCVPERRVALASITIPFHAYNRFVAILDGGLRDGVQFYFVDCPELFDREGLYGVQGGDYGDNWERFGLYCRAVIEASKQLGIPDLFHAHDWHASLLPVMLRTLYYFDPALRSTPCLLTIHKAGHQGVFPAGIVERLDLPQEVFTVEGLEFYGQANLLKGGINYADTLSTVSPTYAREIQTPEFGAGLEGVLRKRSADLKGILNGVDYGAWDPATDGRIAAHFTPERLQGKRDCRRDLMHAFGLKPATEETALLGVVSALSTQKGFDLLAGILPELMTRDVMLVLLGTGEPYYEGLFRSFAERYPRRVGVKIAYDDTMAHKIIAGADLYLMPSRYEPCGLTQIYSLKYGTVPVVHATGGLDDTIEERDPAAQTGTGFKFDAFEPAAFLGALDRAFSVLGDRATWVVLQRNGMAKDFSWRNPAGEYLRLYEESVRRRC
jgi:starch synthase